MARKKRVYKKGAKGSEYDATHGTKAGKRKRAMRNAARKRAMKAGKVKKFDGKEVDHKKPLSKGGSNNPSNTRVISKAANRKKQPKRGKRRKRKKK